MAVFCADWAEVFRSADVAGRRLLSIERHGNCQALHKVAPVIQCEGCGVRGIERNPKVYPTETETPGAGLAILDDDGCSRCQNLLDISRPTSDD